MEEERGTGLQAVVRPFCGRILGCHGASGAAPALQIEPSRQTHTELQAHIPCLYDSPSPSLGFAQGDTIRSKQLGLAVATAPALGAVAMAREAAQDAASPAVAETLVPAAC